MNEVSKSVTDHLIKLQELTQTNLDLLNALNNALFTKQEHLSVKIGDNITSIPSFLSLENKINNLQANFENLINAPLTGEAFFNFDGNSRAIEVRSYTTVPNKLTLNHTNKENPITSFQVEKNNKFKDFLNPSPYINLDLSYYLDDNETPAVPNDITTIIVKKIIPTSSQLKDFFKSKLIKYEDLYKDGVLQTEEVIDEVTGEVTTKAQQKEIGLNSSSYEYTELYKKLLNFTKDVDYIEYDSKYEFPARKNIGHAIYVIKSITEDIVDEDTLFEYLTIQLRNDIPNNETVEKYSNTLTYKLFDETIEKPLAIGDQLITYEGNAKLEITNINTTFNEITVKVLNGEYVNLFECKDPKFISNSSKLRFYKPIDFSQDRIIKVPLEEDQFIYITAAALNNRMNVQSAWGSGLMINTYSLTANDVNINKDINFGNYYANYVNNMGDILTELSHIMSNTLEKYTKTEFESFTQASPNLSATEFEVVQINKHLDNSPVIKDIRSKYSDKKKDLIALEEAQKQIDLTNTKIKNIAFNDASGLREALSKQLEGFLSRRNMLSSNITKTSNEISILANDTTIPIENAKYRIRGFFNYKTFLETNGLDYLKNHIRGIRVQYRYKNDKQEQGNAQSFKNMIWQFNYNTGKFELKTPIFSDWNNMVGFDNDKIPYYDNGYKYDLMSDNFDSNEPSWNQIDIPITQGESVDIRLRVIYDMGYPFVETSSSWSNIVNIKFPEELTSNVEILDIIKENNDDIETGRIQKIINDTGINTHLSDQITDQSVTYYHQPENIASGFYTSERRIIPLKDKLKEMSRQIEDILAIIGGSPNNGGSIGGVTGSGSSTSGISTIGGKFSVYISHAGRNTELISGSKSTINLLPFSYFKGFNSETAQEQTSEKDHRAYIKKYNEYYTLRAPLLKYYSTYAETVMYITLQNNSNNAISLYPLFPGNKDTSLNELINIPAGLKLEDYCVPVTDNQSYPSKIYKIPTWDKMSYIDKLVRYNGERPSMIGGEHAQTDFFMDRRKGVWYLYSDIKNENNIIYKNYKGTYGTKSNDKRLYNYSTSPQTANQFITFRIKDRYNGTPYYSDLYEVGMPGGDESSGTNNIYRQHLYIWPEPTANPASYSSDDTFMYYNDMNSKDYKSIGAQQNLLSSRESNFMYNTSGFETMNTSTQVYNKSFNTSVESFNRSTSPFWYQLDLGSDLGVVNPENNQTGSTYMEGVNFMFVYPKLNNKYDLHVPEVAENAHITLGPGEKISIPIVVEYRLLESPTQTWSQKFQAGNFIYKTISFDLKTSLYSNPETYTFEIMGKYSDDSSDKITQPINSNPTVLDDSANVTLIKPEDVFMNGNFNYGQISL